MLTQPAVRFRTWLSINARECSIAHGLAVVTRRLAPPLPLAVKVLRVCPRARRRNGTRRAYNCGYAILVVYSVISTLKQQLKPGWRIVVTTPNAFYWMNVIKGFFWRYIDPSKQHVNLYDYSTLNNIFELAWYSLADKRFLIFSYLVFNKCKRIDSLLSRLFKYSNLNLFLVFENKI